jgi:hypothetical protein
MAPLFTQMLCKADLFASQGTVLMTKRNSNQRRKSGGAHHNDDVAQATVWD